MSLQVRLRHPLGEQWIDLPERGVDHPLGVGRASGADVQVPSVTVAQKHAVLFVHDGRWVVQDVTPGGPGTYVNGARIEGAAFLHVGDVLTLGADPAAPAIDIDPNAATQGQTGQPAIAVAPPRPPTPDPASASPYGQPYAAPAAYPSGNPQYPGGYTVPAGAPQWPYPGAPVAAPAPVPIADGSIADWPADATPRYYTPRRRRTSDGSNGVIIGMLLTFAITAGTGYWIYRQRHSATPTVQAPVASTQLATPVPKPRLQDDPTGAPASIFSTSQPRAANMSGTATQPATRGTAVGSGVPGPVDPGMSVPPVVQSEPPMASDPDAGTTTSTPPEASPTQDAVADAGVPGDDPAWKQVEAARFLKDEAKAILQFDDYARTHSGAASEKIQQYTEKMLDRIWFERIENLCEQREELNKKVLEVDKDMAEETDAAYKKRVLVPLRQQYMIRLQGIEEELTRNMKYTGKSTPNLLDDAEIDKLRQVRDGQVYAAWKVNVLAHIRKTHGELPWVATKSR